MGAEEGGEAVGRDGFFGEELDEGVGGGVDVGEEVVGCCTGGILP